MNYIKLNELAAQAMGWVCAKDDAWEDKDGAWLPCHSWNPCEDMGDAIKLLEYAAKGKAITIHRYGPEYWCSRIGRNGYGGIERRDKILTYAMTICALRAAGIPESSITEAQEN